METKRYIGILSEELLEANGFTLREGEWECSSNLEILHEYEVQRPLIVELSDIPSYDYMNDEGYFKKEWFSKLEEVKELNE